MVAVVWARPRRGTPVMESGYDRPGLTLARHVYTLCTAGCTAAGSRSLPTPVSAAAPGGGGRCSVGPGSLGGRNLQTRELVNKYEVHCAFGI